MANKSLSSEISSAIEELEALSEASPQDQGLNANIQRLYDELQVAEGKEWDENISAYKEAKIALQAASRAAQEAIDDLSKTANAVSKAAGAIDKLVSALAMFV